MTFLIATAASAFWVAAIWWFIKRLDQKPKTKKFSVTHQGNHLDTHKSLMNDSDFIKEHL